MYSNIKLNIQQTKNTVRKKHHNVQLIIVIFRFKVHCAKNTISFRKMNFEQQKKTNYFR